MPRLTPEEISTNKEALARWQTPTEMLVKAEQIMEKLGSVDLFTQPGIEFVREAWVAAKFGIDRQASTVRLIDSQWPDFELVFGGVVEAFELVEADLPQRRRGQEYKDRAALGRGPQHYPIEEWQAAAAQAPAAVQAAAIKKRPERATPETPAC